MARYQLILKDYTYITLAQEALKRGKTLGKFLNEILDAKAEIIKKGEAGDLPASPICIVCGRKATTLGHGKGQQQLFVCELHKSMVKGLDGYKEL